MFEDENPYEIIVKHSYEVFRNLSEISEKYKVKIILENDAYNKYFYETDLLRELYKEYPRLRLCLDFGRLHLQEKVDKDFHASKVISDLAQYIDLIHLWNVKVNENLSGGHYPVLPEQSPEEGWGDIGSYLTALSIKNNNVKVLFEHRSDFISDKDLERCYKWVNSYFEEFVR